MSEGLIIKPGGQQIIQPPDDTPRPAAISAKYRLRKKKRELHLPVYVVDVDEIFLWVAVERDVSTVWSVGIPWSKIVKILDDTVPDLEKEYVEFLAYKRKLAKEAAAAEVPA